MGKAEKGAQKHFFSMYLEGVLFLSLVEAMMVSESICEHALL